MTVAVCLLMYSLAVVVLGPGLLTRLTRTGIAPRLGVAVWLAAIGSVGLSWAAAGVFLAADLARSWGRPGELLADCLAALRSVAAGESGLLVQIGVVTLAGLAGVAGAALAARLARCLLRTRARTHEHARMARLAGRYVPGLDVVVLDAPDRVAYCVAGRPHTVVVSRGAVEALDERHLAAVLTHERAHLAGHHHLLLAVTRGVATILPRVTLFTSGAVQVARLLEMWADDAAARAHGPRTVLDALLTLSGAAAIPAGALGATGTGVLARAERLAAPPRPAQRVRARLQLTTVAVALTVGPLLTGVLAAGGLMLCPPIAG
jgi:Zn-dependent protease with chaperone function